MRVPPALVLGWHKAFTRRPRSLAAVARLTLPLLLIVVAMSAWTTIDRFQSRPEQLGLPTALTVRADAGLGDPPAPCWKATPGRRRLPEASRVAALVPGPGRDHRAARARHPRGPLPGTPWPRAAARITGPDEAVAGQGLLDLLEVRVGDWVRMTVGDQSQILHIVGRSIEPENGAGSSPRPSTPSGRTTRG